ncbi:MAG: S8 family peptidase [Bacteroidia bacterium]|nr:S8 family peptidase [Bacteroidia bacterium]
MKPQIALMALVLLFLIAAPASDAQHRYWVTFSDRGSDAAERLRAYRMDYSAERLSKRTDRAHPPTLDARQLSIEDLPPAPAYVQALTDAGARVHARSRWLNAVSITADAAVLERLKQLPFVAAIEAVRRYKTPGITPAPFARVQDSPRPVKPPYGLDYGTSLQQVELLRVPEVHDIWIDGTDIIVGMLDNGYRWRVHEAFASTDVFGEYDVINDDSLTENSATDPSGQDGHGTVTFSTLGGFKEGQLIGPAFNAAFLLAKTEVMGSETQIEEDYWVEGLEWLEMRGASVVSASLGYLDWDDGTGYSWERGDLDGKTAVTTRAAAAAARRGLVLVTAMGNEGPAPGSIIAPADADSIIAVGAVSYTKAVAGFSSSGPTSDQRVKPDIVAPGVSVFCANRNGVATYERANGTSLATPLAAGVAALIRSARPELTPVQLRNALRSTADNAATPDNRRGWGLIDAWKALLHHGMVISTNPKIFWSGVQSVVMVWVISPSDLSGDVQLHYTSGTQSGTITMTLAEEHAGLGRGSGRYVAELPPLPMNAEVRFHVAASDTRESRTSPYGAPARQHRFTTGEQRTLGAGHLLPKSYQLYQSFPNPFEAATSSSVTIRYDVPSPGARIRLTLYDALGRRVRTLVDADRGAGQHSARVDATGLANGIYYYGLSAGDTQLFRRMLILR